MEAAVSAIIEVADDSRFKGQSHESTQHTFSIRYFFPGTGLCDLCPCAGKPVEILKSAYGPAVYTRALEQHELPRGDQGADQEKSAELMTSAFGPAVLTRALEQRELPRGDEGADQEKIGSTHDKCIRASSPDPRVGAASITQG